MPREGWKSVSLRTKFVEEIIDKNIGKDKVFKTRASFITHAVMVLLRELAEEENVNEAQ